MYIIFYYAKKEYVTFGDAVRSSQIQLIITSNILGNRT